MSTTVFVTLKHVECANCGILFGITEAHEKRLRETHDSFHCPSGHSLSFRAETEAERLAKKVAWLETDIERKEARISTLREERSALERSRSALRGAHTRTCNRVKNGVCPCCNRTFVDLARHMHTKHPDYNKPEESR